MKKSNSTVLYVVLGFLAVIAVLVVFGLQHIRTQADEHQQTLTHRTIVGMETHNIKNVHEYGPGIFRGDIGECQVQFAYRDGGVRISLTQFPTVGDRPKDLQLPNAFDDEGAWSVEVYDLCIYGGARYNFQDKALQYDQ